MSDESPFPFSILNHIIIGYDRLYQPMTMLVRMRLLDELDERQYRRVAESYVAGWWISTTWIGDLGFQSANYETMIFEPDDAAPELVALIGHAQMRWSWEPDAREGHAWAISFVFAALVFGMVLHGSPVYVRQLRGVPNNTNSAC